MAIIKKKVVIYNFIRYASGVQMHAWHNTNVGVIKKPIQLIRQKMEIDVKDVKAMDKGVTMEAELLNKSGTKEGWLGIGKISWFRKIINKIKQWYEKRFTTRN